MSGEDGASRVVAAMEKNGCEPDRSGGQDNIWGYCGLY